MKVISERISYIFSKFYFERAEKRFIHLLKFAHHFMKQFNTDGYGYYVDEARLSKCVDSYFLDVIRYKEYHFTSDGQAEINSEAWYDVIHRQKKINDSKVAALTAKWLLKSCPIALIKTSADCKSILSDELCHINQLWALNCALYALLKDDFKYLNKSDFEDLFYDFKYRVFDERAYFSRFELILRLVECEKNSLERSTDSLVQPEASNSSRNKGVE
jgi:hypothetical protein